MVIRPPALVPGDLTESLISYYPHLPLDDDLHMPPEGKPQLTETELEFIDQWILAGASPDAPLIVQGLTEELFNWALDYLKVEAMKKVTEVSFEKVQTSPIVDFVELITGIEHHAENSVMRIGSDGNHLVFSAVNARNSLSDDGLSELIKAGPYLIDVDLSHTQVSSEKLQDLIHQSPQLQRLDLSETSIDAESIGLLKKLNELENLVLFNTKLPADAPSYLSDLKQLKSLYIAQTGLSEKQIDEIRSALPETEVVADDFLMLNQAQPVAQASTTTPVAKEPAKRELISTRGDLADDIINLAFGKPVTASSYYKAADHGEVFEPGNITDGRLADTGKKGDWSFWLAQNGDSGIVTIDLEVAHVVSRIDLQSTRNRQHFDRGIKDFIIQVSTDNVNYKQVAKGSLGQIRAFEPKEYKFETIRFASTQARYVRIKGVSNHTPNNNGYQGSGGLNEVRIYNEPSAAHTHNHPHDHPNDHGHIRAGALPASDESLTTGDNGYRFKSDPNWAKFPDGNPVGTTHGGIAVGKDGSVYVSTNSPRSVIVFDSQGNYMKSLPGHFGGIHSLMIREENGVEYLYVAHTQGSRILKMDTQGNILLEINHTIDSPIPGTLKGITAVTVGPDDRIYAAVGYGTNHMHIFSPKGELLKTLGSIGSANDQTKVNHGVSLDTRFSPARLLVADRENRRLVHYDLDGNFIEIYAKGLRRPCSFSFYDDICAVAELEGRVTLLDKSGKVLAHLGDNPNSDQWAKFNTPLDALAPNIFSAPHGIAFDEKGDLIVQDWNKTGRLTKLTRIQPTDTAKGL